MSDLGLAGQRNLRRVATCAPLSPARHQTGRSRGCTRLGQPPLSRTLFRRPDVRSGPPNDQRSSVAGTGALPPDVVLRRSGKGQAVTSFRPLLRNRFHLSSQIAAAHGRRASLPRPATSSISWARPIGICSRREWVAVPNPDTPPPPDRRFGSPECTCRSPGSTREPWSRGQSAVPRC
jgi:hypothetical protein